jgi:hypothetical protein
MHKNYTLLSIGATLLCSLFFVNVGHAFQIDRRQDARIQMAGGMKGTANLPTTQVSTTPNPCHEGGKGRTGAPGKKQCLPGSGEQATDASIAMAADMNSWTGVPLQAAGILFVAGLIALIGLGVRGLRHHHGHHA